MIWFWLCLLSGLILGLLILGGLWVDRWWRRREARKHAEALARQTLATLVESMAPVGAAALAGLVPLVAALNNEFAQETLAKLVARGGTDA